MGINPQDLGTHSIRKGSATFCSSGSTAAPPSAIHLRAGWAMGGVQDIRLDTKRLESMYVGRTVSGLPIDRAEFGLVGPFFKSSQMAREAVIKIFPNIQPNLLLISEHTLTSLVYHSDFLKNVLPDGHPALQSILFRNSNLLNNLKQNVEVSLKKNATGIPPHISILSQIKDFSAEVKQILPALVDSVQKTVDGITNILEERAIGAGTVTKDGLEKMIRSTMESVMNMVNLTPNPLAEETIQETNSDFNIKMFQWDSRFNRLPEDYCLPTGSTRSAFQQWMLNDTEKGISKLRACGPQDFRDSKKRKRFSELQCLMRTIEKFC